MATTTTTTTINNNSEEEFVYLKPNNCGCAPKQVKLSFSIFLFMILIIIVSLSLYFNSINYVKNWLKKKEEIRELSETIANDTSEFLKSNPNKDSILQWFYNLEQKKPTSIKNSYSSKIPEGFVFCIDDDGKVWAHGGASHLSDGPQGNRVGGFHSIMKVDDGKENNPIADMISCAKKGGGYIQFLWKKDQVMISYIQPVKGTDLLAGVAIPVPNCQKVWKSQSVITPKPSR